MSTVTAAALHPHFAHAVVLLHPHLVHALVLLHPHVIRFAARALLRFAAALAARKPRISVITPTWKRARVLLNRCIPSVLAQDYDGEIEHVIVSDGPDPALEGVPGVRFLAEHRAAPNRGLWARLAGTRLATGDLIAYLDDDNAWRPQHLRLLSGAIIRERASFAVSRAQCSDGHGRSWTIGCQPPAFGQVDTSLIVHNAGLLETATWRPSGTPADWDLVSRWMDAGAAWAYVPEITLDYHVRDREAEPQPEFWSCYLAAIQDPA